MRNLISILFVSWLLCLSALAQSPNPTAPTTAKSRELLRQDTAAKMRTVIGVTNAAANLYATTNYISHGSVFPLDFRILNGFVTRALPITNIFAASNQTWTVGTSVGFEGIGGPGINTPYLLFNNPGVIGMGGYETAIQGMNVQIGGTGNGVGPNQAVYMQYHGGPSLADPLGYSHALEFRAIGMYNPVAYKVARPGIQGLAINTNASDTKGTIIFWNDVPTWASGNQSNIPTTPGTEAARLTTTAFTLAAGRAFTGDGSGLTDLPESYVVETSILGVGQRETNANAATLELDFDAPKMWEFIGAPTVAAITVSAINTEPDAGEFKRGAFIIRAGYNARTVTTPSAWANNGGALVGGEVSMEPHTMLRVELDCYGPGITNVFVTSAIICDDPTHPADTEVAEFITAASVSDATQIDALYRLVSDLKGANLWSKEQVIYPFVGGSSSSHSYNLKNSAANQISWTGTVTHSANGAKGNGSTGYGDTLFTPSTDFASQDDCRMFAYFGPDTTGTASGFVAGAANNAGTHRISFFVADNGADDNIEGGWNVSTASGGANKNSSCDANTGTLQGPIMTQRTGASVQEMWLRACTVGTDTDASVGLPDTSLTLFGRNFNGFGVDLFGNMQLSGFSIGTKLTSGEWTTYRQIWERFETRLGRNVP